MQFFAMFERLDSTLLQFTEKAVKRFNWLTGKDNFWLARGFVVFFALVMLCSLYVAKIVLPMEGIKLFLIINAFQMTLITCALFFGIAKYEKISIRNAQRGAKDIETEQHLFRSRVMFLAFLFAVFVMFLFSISLDSQIFYLYGLLDLNVLLATLIIFLISIDKPPFKRSMALESLKDRIRTAFATPVPVPIPR